MKIKLMIILCALSITSAFAQSNVEIPSVVKIKYELKDLYGRVIPIKSVDDFVKHSYSLRKETQPGLVKDLESTLLRISKDQDFALRLSALELVLFNSEGMDRDCNYDQIKAVMDEYGTEIKLIGRLEYMRSIGGFSPTVAIEIGTFRRNIMYDIKDDVPKVNWLRTHFIEERSDKLWDSFDRDDCDSRSSRTQQKSGFTEKLKSMFSIGSKDS